MYKISNILRKLSQSNLIVLIIILLGYGCSDFFEPDISEKEVILLAPEDSLTTSQTSQNFLWDYVDGATGYNLRIVAPSFENIQKLILDTNVIGNSYRFTLSSGQYQWGVSAYNYSSATNYYYRSMAIDTSSQLSGDQPVLISPVANFNTSGNRIHFKWQLNSKASKYIFEIRSNNWDGEQVISPLIIYEDTVSFILPEGVFSWGIQALNDFSASLVSVRSFVVDTTVPATPVLLSPADKAVIDQTPVILSWTRPESSLTAISDSVLIANDSLFTNNSVIESSKTDNTFYDMIEENEGTYFWKVKSFDAAGNKSPYSKHRKFVIKK